MAAPVAAPAVEVGGGLAGFLAAIGCFTLWLLWRFTVGFIILRIADIFAAVSIPTGFFGHIKPFDFAADALRKIDRNVNNALWKSMLASEHFAVWLFLEAAHQTAATSGAIYNGMEATGEALYRLERHYLPWAFRTNVGPVKKSVSGLKTDVKTNAKTLKNTQTQTKTNAKVLHNTIAVTLPRVDSGSRTRDKALGKRLSKVEKLLAAAGFAALVGTALSKLKLGWLRCPNVGKVGRFLCKGIAPNLLEALLAGAVAVGTTISLIKFAEEMGDIVENVADGIGFLVGVTEKAPSVTDLIP